VRRQAEDPEAVEVACADGLLLRTDPGLLLRALGFLVDNAVKYAGSCHIEARTGVIEVTDRGPGIPVRQRSRMFEQFTRANDDTTVPGMGIGLPMARTLLHAAGADLTIAEPPDGVGTRMVVRFT
jgi:signal transduction histidine kinase